MVTLLCEKVGLKIIKTSTLPENYKEHNPKVPGSGGNIYYLRDFLVVAAKAEAGELSEGGGREIESS